MPAWMGSCPCLTSGRTCSPARGERIDRCHAGASQPSCRVQRRERGQQTEASAWQLFLATWELISGSGNPSRCRPRGRGKDGWRAGAQVAARGAGLRLEKRSCQAPHSEDDGASQLIPVPRVPPGEGLRECSQPVGAGRSGRAGAWWMTGRDGKDGTLCTCCAGSPQLGWAGLGWGLFSARQGSGALPGAGGMPCRGASLSKPHKCL